MAQGKPLDPCADDRSTCPQVSVHEAVSSCKETYRQVDGLAGTFNNGLSPVE